MITTERESTTWVRWPLTVEWGDVTDLTSIQVAATTDPDTRPGSGDWVAATIIDDTHALWREQLEIAVLVGPPDGTKTPDVEHSGAVADLQLWTRWESADELVVEKSQTWEVA